VVIESLAKREKLKLYDAQFIWCNLTPQTSLEKPTQEKSPMIYVSYDRADKEFCKEFVKNLRSKIAIPIWVDYEHAELGDDMLEYLSPMIRSATTIIALISTMYSESSSKFQELSYIISTNKSRDEKNGLIVVKAEPKFHFNRSWMIDLLSDTTVIPYENNIGSMASKVCEQIVVSKKSLINCLSCQVKGIRKKTVVSDDFSTSSRNRMLKSVPAADSSLISNARKVSPDTATVPNTVLSHSSGFLIPTTKHGPYSIVAGLITQTGSAGDLTWV
jgi:hypothetical protein